MPAVPACHQRPPAGSTHGATLSGTALERQPGTGGRATLSRYRPGGGPRRGVRGRTQERDAVAGGDGYGGVNGTFQVRHVGLDGRAVGVEGHQQDLVGVGQSSARPRAPPARRRMPVRARSWPATARTAGRPPPRAGGSDVVDRPPRAEQVRQRRVVRQVGGCGGNGPGGRMRLRRGRLLPGEEDDADAVLRGRPQRQARAPATGGSARRTSGDSRTSVASLGVTASGGGVGVGDLHGPVLVERSASRRRGPAARARSWSATGRRACTTGRGTAARTRPAACPRRRRTRACDPEGVRQELVRADVEQVQVQLAVGLRPGVPGAGRTR